MRLSVTDGQTVLQAGRYMRLPPRPIGAQAHKTSELKFLKDNMSP